MDNASNRKQVREAEKASKLAEQNRREVLVSLMSTAPGREWVWNQLERAHIFASSYSFEAIAMAFAEGERNQGLVLLNDIMQSCPDEFILAMREANGRRTEYNARNDNRNANDSNNGADGERSDGEESGRLFEGPGEGSGDEAVH